MARGSTNESSCNAKEGNPFGPFWDTYGIDFVGSEFYGPLHYDVHHSDIADHWKMRYPSDDWPGKLVMSPRVYTLRTAVPLRLVKSKQFRLGHSFSLIR